MGGGFREVKGVGLGGLGVCGSEDWGCGVCEGERWELRLWVIHF